MTAIAFTLHSKTAWELLPKRQQKQQHCASNSGKIKQGQKVQAIKPRIQSN